MAARPLPIKALYRRCPTKQLDFRTTDDLEDPPGVVGQKRAVEALRVGLGIARDGYNVFALGPSQVGRHRAVRRLLEPMASEQDAASDWCYVHNFDDARHPRALRLPSGNARGFARDIDKLIEELQGAIVAALESEEYRARREAIEQEFRERHEKALEAVRERAAEKSIALIASPTGIGLAPTRDGKVMQPDAFQQLPKDEREALQKEIEQLQKALVEVMRQVPQLVRESRKRIQQLTEEIVTLTVEAPLAELTRRYSHCRDVLAHLEAVRKDICAHPGNLLAGTKGDSSAEDGDSGDDGEPSGDGDALHAARLRSRYRVNALVDHGDETGAPIVYEPHPIYQNLVGEVEHAARMGTLVTDFTLIKGGALHRANGGYLLLDARKVLTNPMAWEGLKQALRAREVRIQSLGRQYGLSSTVSLEPEPIPLSLKVVLIGERILYYLLCEADPEFGDLFKIAADFSEEIDWDDDNVELYARLIAALVRKSELKPFNRKAVARVVEEGARLCSDARKLTVRIERLADLLREASYWCEQSGGRVVSSNHVQQAIDAARYRQGRVPELMLEQIERDTIRIATSGERVGQVNGLSVIRLGDLHFGRPSRISATVRLGRGEVVDIEREVDLGGPLHSKGVMILAGYLGTRFGQRRPVAVSARLVFEQSYGGVDGDSASSAELYALLSALGELPLRQDLAVTGSVDQHGTVQAIGGVNEKIEGFFEVCRTRGLSGTQGVLIPQANVQHLMLRQEVVAAVRAKKFAVYAVSTIDEGISLLSGVTAGRPQKDGSYPSESVYGRVEARLHRFAEAARAFALDRPAGKRSDG